MMSHVYAPGGVFQPICNAPPAKATTAPELSVDLQHGRFRLPSKPIMTNCPAAASGAAGFRPLQAAAVKNTAHRISLRAFITSGTIRTQAAIGSVPKRSVILHDTSATSGGVTLLLRCLTDRP